MSKGNSTKAACYFRMSTDKQEHSIDRQRSQVLPYAGHRGYSLVAEYVDEGIAGDEFEKRSGFQKMLRAAERGEFDIILVDEPSRLSRQDPIDFIVKVVEPLRKAGVNVDTVSAGPLDYQSLAGIIMQVIHADKSSGESKTLGRRVLTRYANMAKEGSWTPAIVPYGLRAVRVDDRRTFVAGDEEEVRIVRWIFDRVANHGWTTAQIQEELTRRGAKPPHGNGRSSGRWHRSTIRAILHNRIYLGDVLWNRSSRAKHYESKNGEVVPASKNGRRIRLHDEADVVLCPQPCEALIDRDTWERAQTAMAGNRKHSGPTGAGITPLLFTRMLVCGDCGFFMSGLTKPTKNIYVCSRHLYHGKHLCHRNKIDEQVILDQVVAVLQKDYLNPDNLQKLRAEMERQLAAEQQGDTAGRLQKEIAALRNKIDQGHENLLILPPERHPALLGKLKGWEADLARLESARSELERGEAKIKEVVELAEQHLWRLREGISSADPQMVRAVVREVLSKVELHFEQLPRERSRLVRGVLYLRTGPDGLSLTTSTRCTAQTQPVVRVEFAACS